MLRYANVYGPRQDPFGEAGVVAVFFALAHLLATRHPHARGGFVHVPWLPQQAAMHPGQPSMALQTMIDGVRATLECAIATHEDLHVFGGATH